MKAEERKQLERNELAVRLNNVWQGLTSNSTTVTVIWAVILLGLVALIGYRYYARSSSETRSELWARLDRAAEVSDLEKMAKDHHDSEAGRIAEFHLCRFQFQDALTRLAGPTNDERLKAAEEIEKARDRYAELVKESKNEPLLTQEGMIAVAKAEEVLAGVPQEKNPTAMRGSLDKALEAYEQAAKRASEIRDHRVQIEAFYLSLSKVQGKTETPALPVPAPTPSPSPIIPGPGPDLPKALDAPKSEQPKAPDAPKPGGPQP